MKINLKKSVLLGSAVAVLAMGLTACCNDGPRGDRDGNRRPSPERMFSKLDSNQDNQISKEEARGPLADRFSEIDTNSDGYITKDELKAMPKPQRRGQ